MPDKTSPIKTAAFLISMIAIGVVGCAGKMHHLREQKVDHIHRTMAALERSGLMFVERKSISRDGIYAILTYVRPPCRGALKAVPLQRNAEGADLLGRAWPGHPVRYFLNGGAFEDFPAIEYWVGRIEHAALTALGRESEPPLLFAYSEIGHCELLPNS